MLNERGPPVFGIQPDRIHEESAVGRSQLGFDRRVEGWSKDNFTA
jgi:hypothetical protein